MIEASKAYDASVTDVWTLLRDVESYSKWKPGIKKVDLMGKTDLGFKKWREYSSKRLYQDYEFYDLEYLEQMDVKIITKRAKVKGTTIIRFKSHEGKAILHVKHFNSASFIGSNRSILKVRHRSWMTLLVFQIA